MPSRAQQAIAPVAEAWLAKLFIDELHKQFSSSFNALRQSQNISGNKAKQGLP